MSDHDAIDFFRSDAYIADPYPYFDALREECPVRREPHHGVVMVTGYDEACAIYQDVETFSSCNSVSGPFPGFPVALERDDISDLIEKHRDELPFSDQLPTFDPPKHRDHRALLMRLLTPARLRENEDAMWALADRQIDEFLDNGSCEFIRDYAGPFTLYVIADLLGVPEEDQPEFRERLQGKTAKGTVGSTKEAMHGNPLDFLYGRFTTYVEERRKEPRDDVLTGLATAAFPDGSLPEVIDVVRVAVNLFGAGQETTVRTLAAALQLIAERPEIQEELRSDRRKIVDF